MKRISILLALIFLSSVVLAQQENRTTPNQPAINMDMVQKALSKGRKDIINSGMSAFLHLGDMEKFWPIYANYEKERAQLDLEILSLLRRFADSYEKMDDQQSMKLVSDAAVLQQKALALRIKYFNTVGKSVSGKAAARFYQIDDFISTAVRLDVLAKMPLFGDTQPQ